MNLTGSNLAPPARPKFPWHPDQGDGTYCNPILHADYSDLDVIRVGADFYMTASSFNCTPGLPILHSRDLVNWTILGHALKNLPDPRYAQVQPGCGVWAPAIRFHDDRFWIFFPTPDEGIYVITAPDARGPWSKPNMLLAGKGLIDPCPLWDDDGRAYLVHAYANSRAGIRDKLHVRPMSPDAREILGDGQIVFDGAGTHPWLEGPKFLKRDGWYYLFAPAGSVNLGWQLVLRSRHVYGPYQCRVLMDQGSTPINGPHQGALIDTSDGEQWWFMHFQESQPYGRVVHLQPAGWREDGWPCMGVNHDVAGVGEPVLRHVKPRVSACNDRAVPQTSDDFRNPTLGAQWQWQANHSDDWYSLTARPGHLRLFAQPAAPLEMVGGVLGQKFPAPSFVVETSVELSPGTNAHAGLAVLGRDHALLSVQRIDDGTHRITQRFNNTVIATRDLGRHPGAIRLQLRVHDGGCCSFACAAGDAPFATFADRFQAREGVWVGARFGLFCIDETSARQHTGHSDFAFLRVTSLEEAAHRPRPQPQ